MGLFFLLAGKDDSDENDDEVEEILQLNGLKADFSSVDFLCSKMFGLFSGLFKDISGSLMAFLGVVTLASLGGGPEANSRGSNGITEDEDSILTGSSFGSLRIGAG